MEIPTPAWITGASTQGLTHTAAATISTGTRATLALSLFLQTVDLGVVAPGTLATVSFWEQGLDQGSPSDDAYISLSFLNAAKTAISTVATPEVDSHNGAWQNDTQSFAVPDGTTAIVYTMNFVRHAGSDLDALVYDNSLTLTAAVPEPASEAMLLGALVAIAGVLRSRRVA